MRVLLSTAALGGLLLTATTAAPAAGNSGPAGDAIVHEKAREGVLSRWRRVGSAPESAPVHLSVVLRQPAMAELRRRVDAISDPAHADYGKHLSRDEVAAFQHPGDEAVAAVSQWLRRGGVDDLASGASAKIRFNTTVGTANRLLGCKLSTYADAETGRQVVRAEEYSLPRGLADVVDFVYPVTQFIDAPKQSEVVEMPPSSDMRKRQAVVPPGCGDYITPQCIIDMYNVTYTMPDGPSPVEFAVAGFLEEYPNQAAANTFLSQYSPRRNEPGYSPNYTINVESFNGQPTRPSAGGVEAQLDVQYTMPFVQPMNFTYFSTAGRGPDLSGPNGTAVPDAKSDNEPWVEFLENLLARPTVPQVISISYTDDEQKIPEPYARRVCDMFMQVAARGVSVLVASGDGGAAGIGAAGSGGPPCRANDGSGRRKFLATFPVDCPYVTAVGATGLYDNPGPAYFSSGGFSEYFERPAYQDAAVAAYLNKIGDAHKGWYAPGGRAIPDISAVGSRFLMAAPNGNPRPWTQKGTSASTPVVAAMVALINDKRMRAGKPPLGFLNPLLYSEGLQGAFYDITTGASGSCSDSEVTELGWSALEGWDPATGMGTPNFVELIGQLG